MINEKMSDTAQGQKEQKTKTGPAATISIVPISTANKISGGNDYRAANAAKAREAKRARDDVPVDDADGGDDDVDEEPPAKKRKTNGEERIVQHSSIRHEEMPTAASVLVGVVGDGARLFITCVAAAAFAYLRSRVGGKNAAEDTPLNKTDIDRWTV